MRKALISFAALVALVAAACDPAAYEALPDDTQRDIVIGKTVNAWSNKSDSERLTRLASELNSLSPAEKAQATGWAQQTWAFLDAAQAAQRAAAARASSTDCYAAARRHFPSSQWSKAYQIINRESGGNTYAKNKKSTASGCFQIVVGSWRHPTVGFYEGRFHADTNARAARIIWEGNGWNCTCTWAATA